MQAQLDAASTALVASSNPLRSAREPQTGFGPATPLPIPMPPNAGLAASAKASVPKGQPGATSRMDLFPGTRYPSLIPIRILIPNPDPDPIPTQIRKNTLRLYIQYSVPQ